MSFPKYPAYKDSGVEWIGEIPIGWNLERVKCSVLECKNGVWGHEPQFDKDDITCVRVADFDREKLIISPLSLTVRNIKQEDVIGREVLFGDLLIEKSGGGEKQPVGCVVFYSLNHKSVCSNFIARMKISNSFVNKYLLYVHKFLYDSGVTVRSIKQTSGIQNLDQNSYLNEKIPVPPHPEQQAIANFLDRECGKIDALIAEQEQLIALLAEKRQAVISHAVTKGLNPNAPMKDSGIPWIGIVPEGWEILSLNKVVRNFVDYRGVTPNKVESGSPLITASCIKHGRIDHSIDPVFITEKEYNRRMTRGFPMAGDVILTTEAPLGEVAIVEDALMSPGQRMILFKLDENMSNFYMRAYYLSNIGRQELRSRASGSTASGIRADRLRASAIPVPPLNEQKEICAYIDRKTFAFESLEQQIRYELDLLKERRAALISAAVTGKIDVRAQSKALAA